MKYNYLKYDMNELNNLTHYFQRVIRSFIKNKLCIYYNDNSILVQ